MHRLQELVRLHRLGLTERRAAKELRIGLQLFRALAQQGKNLGGATITLLKQLDLNGSAEVEAAIAEALKRSTPHLAAVRHVLEHRRYERGLPPVAGRHLPIDERVQGPVVTPHPLADYDNIGKDQDHDQ